MKVFAYSRTGYDGIRKYIHNIGGKIDFAMSTDPNGGLLVSIPNADASAHILLAKDSNIIALPFDITDVLPDTVATVLAKHPSYGIQKGDTFGAALKKVRDAHGGDPRWLAH